MIIGDNKGMIHVVDRSLNVTSVKAFQTRVNHIKHAKPNLICAVGDDEGM